MECPSIFQFSLNLRLQSLSFPWNRPTCQFGVLIASHEKITQLQWFIVKQQIKRDSVEDQRQCVYFPALLLKSVPLFKIPKVH